MIGKANDGSPCGSGPRTLTPAVASRFRYTDHDSRGDDREQKARDALVWLEQKDCGECAGANCE
jgi:hypothetical protein